MDCREPEGPTRLAVQDACGGDHPAFCVSFARDVVVRLHTADPSNPQNLADGIVSEDWYVGYDDNANGTTRDSLGGVITTRPA